MTSEYGDTFEELAFLGENGEFITSITNSVDSQWLEVDLISAETNVTIASGWLAVDTNDLGDDWEYCEIIPGGQNALPNDCTQRAEEILDILGGGAAIYRIQSPLDPIGAPESELDHPISGDYQNHFQVWFYHDVVCKDGRIYDGFLPRDGLPIEDYKNLWSDRWNIHFPF